MKYLLSQDELDELKAEHEPVSDMEKYDGVIKLIMSANYKVLEMNVHSDFKEVLKLVIETDKLPRDLLNYIKASMR